MIQYKTLINDQDYKEQLALYNGVEIAMIVTHKSSDYALGSRWKGSLKVVSYDVYCYFNNDHATFRPYNYDSARQALNAAKRYIKTSHDHFNTKL